MTSSTQSVSLPFLVGDEQPDRQVPLWRRPFAHHHSDAADIAEPYDSPFNLAADTRELTVPLLRSFRFVHEPIGSEGPVPFVGRQHEIESLAERILFSDGGSFLVTGHRGVGKTSFVNQVIRKLETVVPWARPLIGEVEIVDIHLRMSHAVQPAEMMRDIVRRLYDRFVERRLMYKLDANLRRTLRLARDGALVEREIIDLSRRLSDGFAAASSPWQRLRLRLAAEPRTQVRLKMVFVIDDLGEHEIEQTIVTLKDLFAASALTFVFVVGEELHERWSRGPAGAALRETVFTHDTYLPCLWSDAGSICEALVDRDGGLTSSAAQLFEAFKKYLAYRSRGVPRSILRILNEHTGWDDDQPLLRYTARDIRRIRFLAGLQSVLELHHPAWFDASCADAAQSDDHRLAVYHVVDWILRRGAREFTLADVIGASNCATSGRTRPDLITPRIAAGVIGALAAAKYIETAPRNLANVVIGVPFTEPPARYRVVRRRLAEMGVSRDGTDVDGPLGSSVDVLPIERDDTPRSVGAFRVVREIGRGGVGIVYEAIGSQSGERVAIKVLADRSNATLDVAAHLEREARTLRALDHPNIVRLVASGCDDGRCYLAMEHLDGITLEDVIKHRGRLAFDEVLAIVPPVLDALLYVHQQRFVRNDVKTTNIMLTRAGRMCLLDFGISRPKSNADDADAGSTTRSCGIIGTPLYMAPEQLCGHDADERSDVYAVGVVIYRMLTGAYPVAEADLSETMRPHLSHVTEPPSRRAPLSVQVDRVVMRCLATDPADRYQSMSELARALRAAAPTSAPIDLAALAHEVFESSNARNALDETPTLSRRPYPVAAPTALGDAGVPSASTVPATGSAGASAPWRGVGAFTPETPAALASDAVAYAMPDLSGFARPYLARIRGSQENVLTPDGAPVAALHLARRLTIGRSTESDVLLRDPNVSRYHAILRAEPGTHEWFIEDANSAQGTYVRGERVIEPRRLQDGDEIQIGPFVFVFGASAAAMEPRRP